MANERDRTREFATWRGSLSARISRRGEGPMLGCNYTEPLRSPPCPRCQYPLLDCFVEQFSQLRCQKMQGVRLLQEFRTRAQPFLSHGVVRVSGDKQDLQLRAKLCNSLCQSRTTHALHD